MSYSYLVRRGQQFHFRLRVPGDLIDSFGVRELHRSLRTSDPRTARSLARLLKAKTEATFAQLRSQRLMQKDGLTPELAQAVLASNLTGFNGGSDRRASDRTSRFNALDGCINAYLIDRSGAWDPKTKLIYTSNLRTFVAVLGNKPIKAVTREDCRSFKDTLICLPPNMTKRFSGQSINQVLAQNPEPMSAKNAQRTLTVISSFFNWAMREGLVAANPIKGLAIPLKTRADAERDAFSPDELHLLFEKSPLYAGCRSERNRHTPGPRVIQDSKFWLPLIGLYSGMRLEEIARLRVCDLRQEQGVWVFDVNGQGDKKLKTPHSRRLVPVHPDLVWRGLLQYHEKLRRVGIEKLWPDLTPGADGFYSSPFSKWFGRYKKKIGIANPKLTFHSLRHTVIDRLKQRDVPEQKIRELVGHKSDSITMSRYGKPFSPAALLEVVKLLDLS